MAAKFKNIIELAEGYQELEAKNEQLQQEINWLRVNGNRAIGIIRGLLATETGELTEKRLKESLEATIVLIEAEHPQETGK